MSVNRFVGLGAAVIVSALQWAPFFVVSLQAQAVRAADGSMPVVVITAPRQR
jgi:hypothetical protein